MNVASRMESTGQPGCIQVSEDTAQLIRDAGKGDWLTPRKELVFAKGKGELQTFWLGKTGSVAKPGSKISSSSDHSSPANDTEKKAETWSKIDRLVVWNCALLKKVLKKIAKQRQIMNIKPHSIPREVELLADQKDIHVVVESVDMPVFDRAVSALMIDTVDVMLDNAVEAQLLEFGMYFCVCAVVLVLLPSPSHAEAVTEVADLYNENPFHDFSHGTLLEPTHTPSLRGAFFCRAMSSKSRYGTYNNCTQSEASFSQLVSLVVGKQIDDKSCRHQRCVDRRRSATVCSKFRARLRSFGAVGVLAGSVGS
jgi:hypothetical protein